MQTPIPATIAPLEGQWVRLGRILSPDPSRAWMATYTGASFALPRSDRNAVDIYVTGRDSRNRSRVGIMTLDPDRPAEPIYISPEPVFDLGTLGAFDENGVSYPWIVDVGGGTLYMYYVGWMPSVLTPFQNHVGLAIGSPNQEWRRFSRAPILDRNNDDFLCIGSVCVLREPDLWRMWYTAFREWGAKSGDPKHVYVIKYAESSDGTTWRRPNVVCIDRGSPEEFSIGRPAVLHVNGSYHMWFSYRGEKYRIGYAVSADGVAWSRCDDHAGLGPGSDPWESESVCYSHVFTWRDRLYMLYCGNHYGRDGLGLALFEPSS